MDAVKSFNAELSSLYEMKPPISKAKMTAITKGAIKAVKFYKHVVQSVEKFLQKCRPEYKIPGLYVIDSIVRQSRHQFGADKDVFAPRFSKNVTFTFYSIYQCTNEEKSKVIRVLNLWQKNAVFPPEVIQPLFDMADCNHPKYKEVAIAIHSKGSSNQSAGQTKSSSTSAANTSHDAGTNGSSIPPGPASSSGLGFEDGSNDASQSLVMGNLPNLSSTEMSLATRLQHLQHLFGQEPPPSGPSAGPSSSIPASSPQKAATASDTGQVRFNKKLLEFDYDEEDEESGAQQGEKLGAPKGPPAPPQPVPAAESGNSESLGQLLTNPDILRHLHSFQQIQQQITAAASSAQSIINHHRPTDEVLPGWQPIPPAVQYGHHQDYSLPPPGFPMGIPGGPQGGPSFPFQQQQHHGGLGLREDLFQPGNSNGDAPVAHGDSERTKSKERDRRRGSRSRSGSRNRSGRTGRKRSSRSRSRDRTHSRRPRSRSRSRSPLSSSRANRTNGRRPRSRSPRAARGGENNSSEKEKAERMERERERERRRRGLPPIKKESLSVCSTTLWVGHLSKLVQQEELSDTFGVYGDITSIDLIPPRGCAFVCMHRRQDAYRALNKLAGHKLQGKAITMAWAPGKGVKAKEWKDFWEVDQGVSYIPWSRLAPPTAIDWPALEEGSSFDEETLPPWIRPHILHNNAMQEGMEPLQPPPHMMSLAGPAPPGFIPLPEVSASGRHNNSTGPVTPDPSSVDQLRPDANNQHLSGFIGAANNPLAGLLPGGPAGLMHQLGIPNLRMPPAPGLPGLTMQLAMNAVAMNAAAAAAAAGGPPGFFNVFNNAHMAAAAAAQQSQSVLHPSGEEGDDMELEDAEDFNEQHHLGGRQRNWNSNGPDHHHQHHSQVDNKSGNLLDRLRSLANHDVPNPVMNGGGPEMGIHPHHPHAGLSPGLASTLRGAPLTASAAEMGARLLRTGPVDPLFSPGGGRMPPHDNDPFMSRHHGLPHHGQPDYGYSGGGGPLRMNPHSPRGSGGMAPFEPRGRGGFNEPSGWDDEPAPPPSRWRGGGGSDSDWDRDRDRDPPPHRHWDRGGRGGGNPDWGMVSPRGGRHPRDRDRGGRDRGYSGGRSDNYHSRGGADHRRRNDRDRDQPPPPPPPPPPREPGSSGEGGTGERRRRSNRWSNRSPDPPVVTEAPATSASSEPEEVTRVKEEEEVKKEERSEVEEAAQPIPRVPTPPTTHPVEIVPADLVPVQQEEEAIKSPVSQLEVKAESAEA